MHRLSLQFPEITLQIANCRENTRADRFASDCILSHAVGLLVAFFFGAAIDAWLRIPSHHLHCFAEDWSAVEARRAKRNGCPKNASFYFARV
jgi:hypothetical protein